MILGRSEAEAITLKRLSQSVKMTDRGAHLFLTLLCFIFNLSSCLLVMLTNQGQIQPLKGLAVNLQEWWLHTRNNFPRDDSFNKLLWEAPLHRTFLVSKVPWSFWFPYKNQLALDMLVIGYFSDCSAPNFQVFIAPVFPYLVCRIPVIDPLFL